MTEFDASVLDEVPSDAAVVARELAILSADPLNSPTPANGSATPVDTSPFDVVALRVPPLLDGQQIANLVESLNSADGVLAPTGVSGVAAAVYLEEYGTRSLLVPEGCASHVGRSR